MSLLRGRGPRRPDPEPFELDNTRVVAAGTGLWLAGLAVLLVAAALGAPVHRWWVVMCLCGAVLGAVGLRVLARRRRPRG